MDHQGTGRTRPAADTRRQPPWPAPDGAGSGVQRPAGPGTGAQRLGGPASGANPVLGHSSGANPVLSRGSGARPVLNPDSARPAVGTPGAPSATGSFAATGSFGRTPARGFPPGRDSTGSFPAGGGYRAGNTDASALMTPDAAEQAAPPGRRHGTRSRRGRRFRLGWLVTAAVVAVVAGLAGYRYLYEPRVNAPVPPTLRLPTSAPASPGFDKALGKWQHIGTRAEDPEPLTITALYPPQFVLDGASYVRTAASASKSCSLAVYGASLQAALQSGHCTQVVRGSYISGGGTMMGTVGVANLNSSSAAQKAGQATGPQAIIAPLTGKKGPTSKLGNGTGVVQAEVKGHYLILMWAEYTSLKSPSGTAQRQALEQFATNLVTGSANINLSTRMLTGKP